MNLQCTAGVVPRRPVILKVMLLTIFVMVTTVIIVGFLGTPHSSSCAIDSIPVGDTNIDEAGGDYNGRTKFTKNCSVFDQSTGGYRQVMLGSSSDSGVLRRQPETIVVEEFIALKDSTSRM